MSKDLNQMNSTASASIENQSAARSKLSAIDLAGIAGLGAVIAIHTTELASKIDETAYIGLGYVLLVAASIASIVLLAQRDLRGWILGGLTCAATAVGFVLTRTVGLPSADGDIGNWTETIAIWSLVAEGLVVALAMATLARQSKRP